MHKNKKKITILIAAVAVVLAVCAVFLVNPIRSTIAFASMTPLETGEVIPGVYAIKNEYVNLFIMKFEDSYVAFDAGIDTETTAAALTDLGISPEEISAVFLTHTDYDHIGALPLFPAAKVYMGESNRVFLSGDKGQTRSKQFLDMAREYVTLDDGYFIYTGGITVRCINTPGHTDGSVSYWVDGKYLFTGDTLTLKNGKTNLSYSVFNMNTTEQKTSLRALAELSGTEAVFTGHSGYTMDFNTAFAGWKE